MFGFKGNVILNIDSDRLSIAALRKSGGKYCMSAFVSREFSGYRDGEFLNTDELFTEIKCLVETVENKFGVRTKKMYIGIPEEFTCAVVKNAETDISEKVKKSDIREVFEKGNDFNNSNFSTVFSSAVYYKKDGAPYKIYDPLNEECSSLSANISYILCEKYFFNVLDGISSRLGIKFTYISKAASQAEYISEKYGVSPQKEYLLINLGYTGTSVMYCCGKSVLSMYSFAMGVLNVSGGITVALDIPLSHGNALTEKLNLNLHASEGEAYSVFADGNTYGYSIKKVNAKAEESLVPIAAYIKTAIEKIGVSFNGDNAPTVFLTGSKLCSAHGVRDRLSADTGINMEIEEPSGAFLKGAEFFSTFALIEFLSGNIKNGKLRKPLQEGY